MNDAARSTDTKDTKALVVRLRDHAATANGSGPGLANDAANLIEAQADEITRLRAEREPLTTITMFHSEDGAWLTDEEACHVPHSVKMEMIECAVVPLSPTGEKT